MGTEEEILVWDQYKRFKKYGEMIYFFDESGALYYLQEYKVNLIFH